MVEPFQEEEIEKVNQMINLIWKCACEDSWFKGLQWKAHRDVFYAEGEVDSIRRTFGEGENQFELAHQVREQVRLLLEERKQVGARYGDLLPQYDVVISIHFIKLFFARKCLKTGI